MSGFINTIDQLGDDVVIDGIIDGSITEFKDDVVTEVGQYAFCQCKSLAEVDLPNVETIAPNVFSDCTNLSTVSIPKLKSLGDNAFNGSGISGKHTFPYLTKIGSGAFRNTPVTSVDLPIFCSGIESFTFYICSNLQAVILRSETLCPLKDVSAFNYSVFSFNGYFYVPSALIEDYKVATNWSTFANQFRALEDYTVDGTTTGALDESKI